MRIQHSLDAFGQSLRELIQHGFPEAGTEFDRLALDLFALQFASNEPYQKLCRHRACIPGTVSHWSEIPSAPTSAFKEFDLTSVAADKRTTVFHSSGTSKHRPSRHFHDADSLGVYEASVLAWFRRHLLPERDDSGLAPPANRGILAMLSLTPTPAAAPRSSLAHMMGTAIRAFGTADSAFVGAVDATGAWKLDATRAVELLRRWSAAGQPVLLLGTAFSFVHLLDFMAATNLRLALSAGSRVMETGGYKGRSRELPQAGLHRLMIRELGIPQTHIICEYGMSELSSQAYDLEAGSPGRVFHFPPWARARIISPETGQEVAEGETGLICVFDLANVRSVLAVQSEDLGVRRGNGFELIGRAALAEVRGCSLTAI
jgi:hypothetical protein